MRETKKLGKISSLSKAHKIEEGRFEIGTSLVRLIRAAYWAKRWAETLPSLKTKENFTLVKFFTKNFFSKFSLLRYTLERGL